MERVRNRLELELHGDLAVLLFRYGEQFLLACAEPLDLLPLSLRELHEGVFDSLFDLLPFLGGQSRRLGNLVDLCLHLGIEQPAACSPRFAVPLAAVELSDVASLDDFVAAADRLLEEHLARSRREFVADGDRSVWILEVAGDGLRLFLADLDAALGRLFHGATKHLGVGVSGRIIDLDCQRLQELYQLSRRQPGFVLE